MKYNSEIHHRRSIRLRGYDYSQAGAYFVTICTHNRECLFGDVADGVIRVNHFGKIVGEQWNAIPQRFPTVELDAFVVMPNHIHGIFAVGAPLAGAQIPATATGATWATARVAPTVGDIVGAYKSLCVHHGLLWMQQNQPHRMLCKLWQRNYWEHIIRDESELNRIREYIQNNPAQWKMDKLHPGREDRPVDPTEIREPSTEYAMKAWMV